jgi:hypothetical protein
MPCQLHTAAVLQRQAALSIQQCQPRNQSQMSSTCVQQHISGWQQLAGAVQQQHLPWHLQQTAAAGFSTSRHTHSDEDLRVV